jgi:hypothetical protein
LVFSRQVPRPPLTLAVGTPLVKCRTGNIHLNKWSVTSLTILIAVIIGFLWLTSQQTYGAIAVPFLSGVLGFLLKALSDSITTSQRRQWELDDIARERTLKYYERKLDEISLFLVTELEQLSSIRWKREDKHWRISDDAWQITREWLSSAATIKTFSKTLGDSEIVEGYIKTSRQHTRLLELVENVNLGNFDTEDHSELQKRLLDEMNVYMDELHSFQLGVELVRLKVIRGELTLNKKDS